MNRFAASLILAFSLIRIGPLFAQWSTTPVNNTISTPNVLSINNGGYAQIQLGDNSANGFIMTKEFSDNSYNLWTGPTSSANLRMRIANTGEVGIGSKLGIGTYSPVAPLHINNGGYAAILMGDNSNTGFVISKEAQNGGNTFNIWSGPFGNSANRLAINSDGNIGINTPNPGYKLDVTASRALDGLRLNYTGYVLLHPNSLSAGAYNSITQAGDAGIVFGDLGPSSPSTSYGFIIAPWQSASSGIRIDRSGNVGIGAADTKGYQLAVNGQAIFTKVVVKQYSNWPDYVFDSAYRLLPVKDLRQYVKANHHLPDMPSADIIAATGLDLGANQTALLKKIEELTLYTIAQDEQLQIQKRDHDLQMKSLQDRLNKMERLLEKCLKHE